MALNMKKITPKDVFLTNLSYEEHVCKGTIGKTPVELKYNQLTGNKMIDELAELMAVYRARTASFYEKSMGIKAGGLNHFMMLYTGMNFQEWRNEYFLLMAKELLLETDYTTKKVGKRLGYSGDTTFRQWFIKVDGDSPAKWRRYARYRRAKEEEALVLKFRREEVEKQFAK